MAAPIVVKVGTSTLTDAQGRLDRAYLYELAWQVAAMRRQGRPVVLVSSGAVRAGCERLGWTRRPQSIPLKQAAAAVGQGELIHAYNQAFGPAYPVAQVLLTRQDAADRERYVNARNTLTTLLRHGCIPIVNENDTVAVDEIRFGDNDTLAAQVAALVAAELLVLLTDVPGFLDEAGQVIPRIDTIDERIRRLAGGSGRDGSGGMITKLAAAEIARARRPVILAGHGILIHFFTDYAICFGCVACTHCVVPSAGHVEAALHVHSAPGHNRALRPARRGSLCKQVLRGKSEGEEEIRV